MSEPWTTLGVLDWTTKRFTERNISGARLEAQILLAHVLACSRMQLYTAFDKPLGETELAAYRDLIKRRLAGEPVAYLTGETEFWSLPFVIDASVLVPRPDTETVMEVALKLVDKTAAMRVLDLCTGSGVLAVSLAKELSNATVIAVELSPKAAEIAKTNATKNGVAVDVRLGDLWAPVDGEYDLIVSNPPYIASSVIPTLSTEVKREPVMALDGGTDGYVFYDRIAAEAMARLAPGGVLVLEHGYDQAEGVAARLAAAGLVDVTLVRDLAKNPRVTYARRPRPPAG